jgi:hypothetical protein
MPVFGMAMLIWLSVRYRSKCGQLAIKQVLMSYFASVYVRIITGMKIHDATAFICYKREVLGKTLIK